MASFILYGSGSSSFMRIYRLALIILMLVCSFSYCSSSSNTSNVDIGENDDGNINDKNHHYYYRLPFRPTSSAMDTINADEHPILFKYRLRNLLVRPALIQDEARRPRRHPPYAYHDRNSPQIFQAMRG
jgi:hypothetical protein